jgi:cell division protein FtsQ
MSPVFAPADRRFRRAHVKPSRTRRGWRRAIPRLRYFPFAVLVAYAVYLGSQSVVEAGVLTVNQVVVRGNSRLSEGEVLAVLSGLRGESLLWTDLDRWRQRLLASPWVRDAALRRSLPSTVEVVILERQPIGIGRLTDDMYLVDQDGTIIDQYGPQFDDLDLPLIDGLVASGGPDTPTADPARADFAGRVINALKAAPDVGRRLSQINVSDPHNALVILAGDPAVIALGEDQFLTRLRAYLELAAALRERVADIDYVDVRFDNRIYVRPRKTRR